MSVLNENQLLGSSGAGGGYNLENSLRFRSSASAYLSRTFPTAGNRKIFTISLWMKGGLESSPALFQARASSPTGQPHFTLMGSNGSLYILDQNSGITQAQIVTTAVLRDPSAWYHIVVAIDTTEAIAADRAKIYVNSEKLESFSTLNTFPLNYDTAVNNTVRHLVGARMPNSSFALVSYLDGYLTEVNFVDGQALTPSDFGETNASTGVWQPIEYEGTYGTNGFYLPFKPTTQATGFNTVTYTGNGTGQSITGVGFSPDLLWIKSRSNAFDNTVFDTSRGVGVRLITNSTGSETATSSLQESFDNDGFTLKTAGSVNQLNSTYVAWCWDAGSGSPVSNTDGTITSTVKANPATGFSVVTFTGNSLANATVGHGLGVAPKMVITKLRNIADNWIVHNDTLPAGQVLLLNSTNAAATSATSITTSATTLNLTNSSAYYATGRDFVSYCFADVAGYQKIGTYTGNGSTDGPTITTGFRPAFFMVKRTDSAAGWIIQDTTRDPTNPAKNALSPDSSAAESVNDRWNFLSNGIKLVNSGSFVNASGGTYIYLAIADTRDAQFNFDASGNKNNWTANNINSNASGDTTYDIMTDVPTLTDEDTANYATFNPLGPSGLSTNRGTTDLSNGNLSNSDTASQGFWAGSESTIQMSIGKHYAEFTIELSGSTDVKIGINGAEVTDHLFRTASNVGYQQNGNKWINSSPSAYGATYTNGDVIGVAFDADAQSVTFYKNNVSQGAIAVPNLVNRLGYTFYATVGWNGGIKPYVHANFGQRPFKYTPPTGYLKLNTFNLPDSSIVDGSEHFGVGLWTGTGSVTAPNIPSVTNLKFKPEFLWSKSRSTVANNYLYDIARSPGDSPNKFLGSNTTDAEQTFNAFTLTDTGFNLATTNVYFNQASATYAAWNWKAGGTAVSNTDGTIASQVSANTTAGFSVVTYTGNGTAGATIGHGLGANPAMIIVKGRTNTNVWAVYRGDLGGTKRLLLNTTSSVSSDVEYWNNTDATSSVFTVRANAANNGSGQDYVAYCWSEVEGYSKFGSYTGNGSTNGPFVYTGFRPTFVMIKQTSGLSDWWIWDTARETFNQMSSPLYPSSSSAEVSNAAFNFDILSNGFKMRSTNATVNGSGLNYIYMAFAENPFKNSLAR